MVCGRSRVELLLDVGVDQVELVVPAGLDVAAEVVDDGVCSAALERVDGGRRDGLWGDLLDVETGGEVGVDG
jgi:hypothetical protein